jgi:NDP-sugar pyrophosphorylase family protein
MDGVVGIGLAGGQGVRARPLTLEAREYLRSKAAMCFASRPLVEWQVIALQEQGIGSFYVIANGRENRYQVKEAIGHGEGLGVRVRYSRPRMDRHNTGSGEATLSSIEHWGLDGLALVFPTDSLFEFDLREMVRAHRAAGALVTVGTVDRTAAEVAGKYGVVVTSADRRLRGFVEKPPLDRVLDLVRDPNRVPINAGLYLIDCARLREVARTPAMRAMARDRLDWGHDLLPWLVDRGYPVRAAGIAKIGDLGNPRDYLETLADALAGEYPFLLKRMGPGYRDHVWIHESSLRLRDAITGMTLAEKLEFGLVRIGPNVLIGREVEIEPGVVVADSHIGDGVDLHARCQVRGSAVLDGAVVGPDARVIHAHVGVMARVESTSDSVTTLDGYSAIGHEVTVCAGASLTGARIDPNCVVPADMPVPERV